MLLTPLYKVFNKVTNPQKFFRKHFIAAAFTAFATAYIVTGVIAFDIAKTEWKNRADFKITDVLSWNLISKHGTKGVIAIGSSYAGDISLIYGLAGAAYWRQRRRKEVKNSPIPTQQKLENL